MSKTYDLVLFGATGFTGQRMFDHLVANAHASLRWAIGGRDRHKLEVLLRKASGANSVPDALIADASDATAIDALVASTRVVIQAAGPYARYGENFFRACVEHETDYVDIGGETFFLQQMIAKYHAQAAERGVRMIPCAGYEALPFDLVTSWIVESIRERFNAACSEVKVIASFSTKGAGQAADVLSGGSVATLKNLLELDHSDCLSDPACLSIDMADVDSVRERHAYDFGAAFDEDIDAYRGPAFPAPFLNVPVVLRSSALYAEAGQPYGPDFRFVEGTHGRVFGADRRLQWAAASGVGAMFRGMNFVFKNDIGAVRYVLREFLDRFAPRPGEGPSDAALRESGYRLDVFGRSVWGDRIRGHVVGSGHPGYVSTAAMAVEAGLALAFDRERLPRFKGILTPATGLGTWFCERLKRAGIEFSLSEDSRP